MSRSDSESANLKTDTNTNYDTIGDDEYRRQEDEDDGCGSFVSGLLFFLSFLMIVVTMPFSLCFCIKMVQVGIES